jgi:hypothetical protein
MGLQCVHGVCGCRVCAVYVAAECERLRIRLPRGASARGGAGRGGAGLMVRLRARGLYCIHAAVRPFKGAWFMLHSRCVERFDVAGEGACIMLCKPRRAPGAGGAHIVPERSLASLSPLQEM